MISLSYNAALDPFHTIFRMFAILTMSKGEAIPVDALRILDFYACFPWLLSEFRPDRNVQGFLREHNKLKQQYAPSGYDTAPQPVALFERMRTTQMSALSALASYGFIDASDFDKGLVALGEKPLPQAVSLRVQTFVDANRNLIDFLTQRLGKMDLYGANGLKARSHLGEFRYDDV